MRCIRKGAGLRNEYFMQILPFEMFTWRCLAALGNRFVKCLHDVVWWPFGRDFPQEIKSAHSCQYRNHMDRKHAFETYFGVPFAATFYSVQYLYYVHICTCIYQCVCYKLDQRSAGRD